MTGMPSLDRRTFLFLTALLAPAARLRALIQPGPAAPVSRDAFLLLSQRLLERSTLDPGIAALYRDALLATPETAARLADLIRSVQAGAILTADNKALEATLIEWWYTGVYQSKGEPRLATHTGALMWGALGMPAPGACASAFGAWANPPKATKKA